MSEQIREQVSAFLDGELPNSETELLLKRLMRDGELRESFGRYALIGEALRGTSHRFVARDFAGRVNQAVSGEPALSPTAAPAGRTSGQRWWRPVGGVAVAAGVAAVAIVALQQRAIMPASTLSPTSAQIAAAQPSREAISYTVPVASDEAPALTNSRLTNYVFAHSKYSSVLGQRGVLADMLIEDEEQQPPRRDDARPPAAPQLQHVVNGDP
jgi:sigma-E factor negative regulatory protein RseA